MGDDGARSDARLSLFRGVAEMLARQILLQPGDLRAHKGGHGLEKEAAVGELRLRCPRGVRGENADGAVLLAGPGMHGDADEGETLHFLGGSAEELVFEVRVLAHARDNDSFVGLENLAGDARAWFVGRFRRLGIAIGHGKAEVTAFGILHDDMRALEMHGFCESREEFPQHLTEGFVGRQGHNNPVQRLKARLNIKRVRFFRHKKTHKRGKRPPRGGMRAGLKRALDTAVEGLGYRCSGGGKGGALLSGGWRAPRNGCF